jgi:hypothetical protein
MLIPRDKANYREGLNALFALSGTAKAARLQKSPERIV